MSAGLTGFVEGRVRRGSELATADLAIRKVAAVEALSRYGKAKAALLGSVAVEPNLWPTSAVIDWIGVLKRVGDIPERAKKLTSAQQILRSRLNLQGTSMGFSTERADGLWWLMVTPDVNAVRTLLAVVDLDAWKEDAPRIAKGSSRQDETGALGHDDGECLGDACLREVLGGIREGGGIGQDNGLAGVEDLDDGLGLLGNAGRRHGSFRLARQEGKSHRPARGRRRALGDSPGTRGDPPAKSPSRAATGSRRP